ncbi:hypothetical protein RND71_030952 [Anisodus tanguticus]|uniref:Uncharacterized protein n=1 Tax=Anisodus tanguticus TaxID=243964 RepID=A0AAE1V7U5_9SOLA|nr:hypothetical protein RND71_030952 [Anisodus tanguticus]
MFKRFICGKFHHRHQEYDDVGAVSPKSKLLSKTRKKKKNPYAERGLEKFSKLLADIEDKKQNIYTQMGCDHDDISLVRFVFTNSNECKPIVVMLKNKETTNEIKDTDQMTQNSKQIITHDSSTPLNEDQERKVESKRMLNNDKNHSWNITENWRNKPHYYLLTDLKLKHKFNKTKKEYEGENYHK